MSDNDGYLEAKKYVQDGLKTSAEQYDKAMLALAGGVFGVSIAFLKDIAPDFIPWTGRILLWAWGAFLVSMCSTLWSFLTSQSAFLAYERFIDERQRFPEKPPVVLDNRFNNRTQNLNWLSLASFILGAALLAIFSYTNLHPKEKKMGNDNQPANVQQGKLQEGGLVARPMVLEGVANPQVRMIPSDPSMAKAGAIVAGPLVVPTAAATSTTTTTPAVVTPAAKK
jgi:hypothetical protein